MAASDQAKLSSTVLLLRDTDSLEVLMVRRHHEIEFASNALVFPGGKLHEEDFDPAWSDFIKGDFPAAESALRIAAIRETYEEAGIILARHKAGGPELENALVGPQICARLDPFRRAVDLREQSFLALIKAHNLALDLDSLIHFGHWITPEIMPKRFDTHFYLAPLPTGQTAHQDGRETTEALWLGPEQALTMEAESRANIIFPTRMNLKKLLGLKTVEDAESRFKASDVMTILPKMGKNNAGVSGLFIPEEAGYGQTFEPLSRIKV